MNNLQLLEYCRANPEKPLDAAYMFIEKDRNLEQYVERIKQIKSKLFAIKELSGRKSASSSLDDLFGELKIALDEFGNISEFASFINACDTKLEEAIGNDKLFRHLTQLYLDHRDLTDIVPAEWIQAMLDKLATKKKGHVGTEKFVKKLVKAGYTQCSGMADFINSPRSVACCASKGEFSIKNIKRHIGVAIGKKTQNKSLDLLVKDGNDFYFIEAKHLNTAGGGQNKQIAELIELIKNSVKENMHFVALLDGLYSNVLLGSISKKGNSKPFTQMKDINGALAANRGNYWLNTAGFEKLFVS